MQRDGRRLEFGWFLPTAGDTTAYGLASAQVAPSLPLFDRVVEAAEAAGFEYMLVPVQTACWEAWISSAMMVARSKSIRMLVAARPSYINPVLLAKMIAAFDQLSGGRICINLIAGPERGRERVGRRQVGQGRALRDHGRGGLDPEGAVDGARPGRLRRQVLPVEGRADPAPSAAEALSQILSRRRLQAGLGDLGQALRRASLLGRHLRAHPRQHGRDPRHGRPPRPRERHRLRHAPAGRLPADREGGVGVRPRAGGACHRGAEGLREGTLRHLGGQPPRARAGGDRRDHRAASVDRHHPGAAGRRHRRGRRSRAMRRDACRTSSISAATPSACRATCTTRKPNVSANG